MQFITALVLYSAAFLLSGALGWPVQLAVVSCSTVLVYWYFAAKRSTFRIMLLMLPAYLVYLGVLISNKGLWTLPIVVFPVLFFVFCYITKRFFKSSRIAYAGLLILGSFPGWLFMQWYLYYYYAAKYDRDHQKVFPDAELYATDGNRVSLDVYGDTLLVLDFWSTSCGSCFKQFPDLKLMKEYYKNEKVKFFTVNAPLPRDSFERTVAIIGNHFDQNLFVKNPAWIDSLYIETVPRYVLVRKGEIVFKGYAPPQSLFLRKDLYDIVDNALVQ